MLVFSGVIALDVSLTSKSLAVSEIACGTICGAGCCYICTWPWPSCESIALWRAECSIEDDALSRAEHTAAWDEGAWAVFGLLPPSLIRSNSGCGDSAVGGTG